MNRSSSGLQLLAAWQRGELGAEEKLIAWCGEFVTRDHSGGMTDVDRDSIVNEAWSEFLEIVARRRLSRTGVLVQELKRALWRAKKRWQRQRDRISRSGVPDSGPHLRLVDTAADPASFTINRQLLKLILEKVFLAFEAELPKLSRRDHDLVTRLYRLEADYPPKESAVFFRTAAAARKACSRARRRLAQATDEWLECDLGVHPEDRRIIRLAQEVVRGDRVLELVDLLEEFDRDAL